MAEKQQIMKTAMEGTNKATAQLIGSTKGAIIETDALTAAQHSSTLAAKAQAVALKAASIAGNMIAFAVIIKGIELVVKGFDNWIHRVEKANEAMQDAVGEYESAKSSLESINSELKEQNKKIDELLSKDKLTYAEKGQLEELQAITRELLLQQDIEQRRADKASKDVAEKTVDAYNKQYGKYDISREKLNENLEYTRSSGISPIAQSENDIVGNIAAYVNVTEGLRKAQQEYEAALKNGEDTEFLIEDVQDYIDAVDDYSDVLDKNISDLQEKRLALEDEYNKAIEKRENGSEPLTSYEQDAISTYESIYDTIKLIYEYTNKNDWNNMEISNIFNTDGIEKTKEELVSMYKSGELSSAEMLEQFPKLNQAIKDSELIAGESSDVYKEFFNEIAALADEQTDVVNDVMEEVKASHSITETIDQLNTQLKPTFDSLKSAYQDIFTTDDNGKPLFTLENVDLSMLDDIKSKIDDINKNEELGIHIDYSEFENLATVLTDTSSTADDVHDAFDKFATGIVNATTAMDGMTEETAQLVKQMLESLGVANAEEVAMNTLTEAKAEAFLASHDLADATEEEIAAMLNEAETAGIATDMIFKLVAEQQVFSAQDLSTEGKVAKLKELAEAYGQTAVAAKIARMEEEYTKSHMPVNYGEIAKAAATEINNAVNNVHVNFNGTDKSKSKKSSSSKKETDKWLEEYKKKLAELQNLLDKGRLMPSAVVIQYV